MKNRTAIALWFIVLIAATTLHSREWRSADGKRSFDAAFVSLRGDQLMLTPANGKPAAYPLAAFNTEDQQFAKNAQAISEGAAKMGPQAFEVSMVTDAGCVCRMALPGDPKKGPLIFTGEMFFLTGTDAAEQKQGAQFSGQLLFAAGGRTFHPLKGDATPIRAFALNAEDATRVWMETAGSGDAAKLSPDVIEPEIKIITRRTMGLALSKDGLVLAPAWIAKDASSLAIHIGGKDEPATLLKRDDKLGVATLVCKVPLQAGRFGARKAVEVGQNVFAVSYELSPRGRTIGTPSVTRGIISRATSGDSFKHDATVPPETIGGFVVGEKGDVLGVFFPPAPPEKTSASSKDKPVEALADCIRTEVLAEFLKDTPGAAALRSSPGGEIKETADALRASSVLVIATREVRTTRVIAAKKTSTPPAAGAGGGAAGFSLSGSGTRHNSKCRFYDPQKPCAATDGRACKTCGG